MTTVPFLSKRSAATLVANLVNDDRKRPMFAILEVADRCNEVCVHCYQVQGQKGEISTGEWKQVMDQLAELGVLFLTITGGEATLRKDFLELVAYARKRKFAVKVFSNGLNIDERMAQRLGELAVQEAQLSLYSTDAADHDWTTGVPGSFARTVAAARHLRANGVAVVIKTPLFDFNVGKREDYARLATELDCDYLVDPEMNAREGGDRSPERLAIDEARWLEVRQDRRFAKPETPDPLAPLRTPQPDAHLCGACAGQVHVDSTGTLKPCALLPTQVGNAVSSLKEDFYGHREAVFLREMRWKDIRGCRDCDLQPYCHRCFAAGLTAGDALAPYPKACVNAQRQYQVVHGVGPEIGQGPGGDRPTGPYRALGVHRFETAELRTLPVDEARAQEHPWVRSEPAPDPGLVQLRRPNGKPVEPRSACGGKAKRVRVRGEHVHE